jgi:GTPase SAR1 family protein
VQVSIDVKELISLEDVMEEMELGPNGGLVFCMEYLIDNLDWLNDELEQLGNEAYVIFDCPGQIELFSHVPVMRTLVTELQRMDFAIAGVYLLDSQFMVDPSKYMSVSARRGLISRGHASAAHRALLARVAPAASAPPPSPRAGRADVPVVHGRARAAAHQRAE